MRIGIGWSFIFLEGVKSPFVMSHHIETVLASEIGVPLVKLIVAQDYFRNVPEHSAGDIRRLGLTSQES